MLNRCLRILVADDEPTSRLLMQAALENAGFAVDLAVDGELALRQFHARPYDMVMLDVDMPVLDGYQVCAALRSAAGAELPIVMVTGKDDLESINRAYEVAATDFIPKPINWSLLGHRVKYLFRSSAALLELRTAHAHNKAVLNAIPDLMFEFDRQGRYLDYHTRRDELLHLPPEHFLGRTLDELMPPEIAGVCLSALAEADEKGYSTGKQYELRVPQGKLWFELSVARKNAGLSQEPNFIALVRDVTERKQAEQVEQFRGRTLELLVGGAPLADILEAIARGIEELKPSLLCDVMLFDNDGRHPVRVIGACTDEPAGLRASWSQPILSSAGKVLGAFAVYHRQAHSPGESEISFVVQAARLASIAIERKEAKKKIQLAANVFTHAREGIMITETDGSIIDVNEAFTRITSFPRDEVLGRNPRILQSGLHDPPFYQAMWHDLIEHGHWDGELRNRRKNGEAYVIMQTISAVRDCAGNTEQYVALCSDISALKEHERQLQHMAHYDALTTLPNRVLLADRLQQAMVQAQRRKQRLAVAYLDLDGFKEINDLHGHDAGDHLLATVAGRMKQVLREGDTLARLGGDEFVAVLLDLADDIATVPMLCRLRDAAAQPVQASGRVLQVSASLGVTFYPQAEEVDADQLLRQADQAMYQAKLAGKDRYHVFDTEQDRSVRGHNESLGRIRSALIERELVLHYQPKVNMRTGRIVGAEALVRWQHPERGLLPPAAFLPVIEDHPLAVDLGEWVIDSALTQMSIWSAAGLDIQVSVNVGARQLQQANFVDRLRALLATHSDVRPGSLQLEVLETSALEDLARISEVIEVCREIGVSFALDDFGTGYSSLTYLKRLAVDQLKIDQSFVRGMLGDAEDLVIIGAVLGLAKAFNREAVAEGVETVEHGELLLQLGCELAQGYGIARPMPAAEFPAWAAAWRPDPAWRHLPTLECDHMSLLLAGVEYRAWVSGMEEFLRGERAVAPPNDRRQCRFGRWLAGEGQIRYAMQPAMIIIERLHGEVHALAAELIKLRAADRVSEALARLGELRQFREALLAQLKTLAQASRYRLAGTVRDFNSGTPRQRLESRRNPLAYPAALLRNPAG
jgi:diguanylate cyclase (GGDEF)-like protein/PAS domain S-box-containing protein